MGDRKQQVTTFIVMLGVIGQDYLECRARIVLT